MDLPLDSIICHDVVKPFPLPDQCIDVVFTSPPYWGLRDYGIKSIFGGDPNCKHKWSEEKTGLTHENRNFQKGSQEEVVGQKGTTWIRKYDEISSGFCQICGAWLGQLGLEPHPQMFIDHLVIICQEIKRVLKKSGSFYLNLGDTYCGSGCGTNDYRTEKSKSIQGIGKNKNLYKTGGISAKLKYDGRWIQPKQLLGIPERVMIALQNEGWILRNKNVWHKLSSMPSSVKTRLNNTWEPVFRFVKPSKKREWCIIGNIPNKDKYPDKYALYHKFKEWSKNNQSTYSNSGNVYKISEIPEKYYPIIMRLDEYFDLDAIREPHKASSLDRAKYDFNLIPRAWEQEVIPVSGGKKVNIDCHPAGKNPGDIFYNSKYKEIPEEITSEGRLLDKVAYERKILGIPHELSTSHPNGKNPGDVVKHDIAVGRIGNFSYNDPLHTKEYHSEGKNPGDVIQFDEEYWWNFILGRAHSNRFYKKAYELMRNWMIKNNCFDYAIFYEWYREEFKGKWESGTLEKGKANYLSDEKILPFPKPETRFLGDMPGDFWNLATQPFTGYNPDLEHFAVFPEELVLKPLKASCPKGGVVLDPFCGRGTVGKVAKQLGLHYILFDAKPEYCELAHLYIGGQKHKLHRDQSKLGAENE